MTCIVGLIENKKVYIGADSAGVSGLNVTIRKDRKVFKVGEFVIGCTSSFRMIQLLMFSFHPPKRHEDEDIFKYMCTAFVSELRKCFREGGFMEIDKGAESGGTFLIGWRDRLFCIMDDYQVEEAERPFNAVGCGQMYAIGALEALHKDHSTKPFDLVNDVLDIAAYRSGGVAPPYVIETT